MKNVGVLFITLCVTLLLGGVAMAEMYKWVDEKGVIHFTDREPYESGSGVEFEVIPTYENSSQVPDESFDEGANLESAVYNEISLEEQVKAVQKPKVELYTTSWCKYCAKARTYFRERGISFKEYDIEKDKSAARRKIRLGSRKGVPFAVVNGEKIHGFAPVAYERALSEKR
jgi:glutaredoxin